MHHHAHAGLDVSAATIQGLIEYGPGRKLPVTVKNTPRGHQQLIKRLQRCGPVRVCMEATGVYGLDLAVALHRAPGIEVVVVNPRTARDFAKALNKRAKTDPVDAQVLLEYAKCMPCQPWSPPAKECLHLRVLARRMHALTRMLVEEKNRLHAAQSSAELRIIRSDIEVSIRHIQRRIERLKAKAKTLIDQHEHLRITINRLISVKGIALTSAIGIFAELAVLPQDMTARQWVAHAGLDPRIVESGTSVKPPARISKAGNKYLRAALYMPALTASQFEPHVKAFYDRLVDRGRKPMQANVAVMRKLLHAIHGMLKHQTNFDGRRFAQID